MFGVYLCCDQARPPAGDLGRGGAVLEKRKEGGGKRRHEKGSTECYLFFFIVNYCHSSGNFLSIVTMCQSQFLALVGQ